jgi:hypothetical protein
VRVLRALLVNINDLLRPPKRSLAWEIVRRGARLVFWTDPDGGADGRKKVLNLCFVLLSR